VTEKITKPCAQLRQAAEYLQMKQQEDEKIERYCARSDRETPVKCEKCGEIRLGSLARPAGTLLNLRQIQLPAAQLTCLLRKIVKEGDLFCTRCGSE
jgi:hypothetical protein